MFYDKFLQLCNDKGVSPTAACMEMKISNSSWRRWRDGSSPRGVTIKKICDYFNVTPSSIIDDEIDIEYLTPDEESRIARMEAFNRAEIRTLFDAAIDLPASKIYEVIAVIERFKEESKGK